MAKHSLYDESPHLEHDDQGKVRVKKTAKAGAKDGAKDDGDGTKEEDSASSGEAVHTSHQLEHMNMGNRHIKERMDMHTRHSEEMAAKADGDKGEMHKRHAADMKEMHGRHESEMKAMHTRHAKHAGATGGDDTATGEPIEKVEKGAKQ